MLLPRRHYLAIAGVDTQLFKTLQRRNQVPTIESLIGWSASDQLPNSNDSSTDYVYSAYNAVMLAVSHNLVDLNSFARDSAKEFVLARPKLITEAIEKAEAGKVAWLAAVTFDRKARRVTRNENGEIAGFVPMFGAIGTISEVVQEAETLAKKREYEILSINLLNTTRVIRKAMDVAAQLELNGSFLSKD